MSSGLYSTKAKDFNQKLDLTRLKPYGDTMNDGKTQVSFTLPVPDDDRSLEAAKQLATKMGLDDVQVCFHQALDKNFTFYIVYGNLTHTIDITTIKVNTIESEVLDMHSIDEFIKEKIGRNLVVIGASTGTDAHTVGIDAIMNMKGYAGHYGLERYQMIDAYNLGSQVDNHDFIKKAVELKADVLLVSQTVTQKDIHIANMVDLVEQLEAANLRDKFILIAGGPRITNDLAKELGYDAGFGPGKYSEDVASFFIDEFIKRKMK
jgi:beta-lysine 5,6-aminomutase beta subunit